MKTQKIFFLLIAATAFFSSCKKEDPVSQDTSVAQTLLDQSYGNDAKQRMDIYLPAGRSVSSTKVMIMIHGGGWTSGDKADFNTVVDTLKKRLPDYAIFNINYRLSANPFNIFPTQEDDVKAAITYIHSKEFEYNISSKYVLLGASAGGHLAMLQGYKNSSPVKAKAVVSFFGPGDLTDMYNNPVGGSPLSSIVLANAIGATPAQNASIYTSSSPVNYITNTSAMPTILIHGGADPLVSPSQSVAVQNKLALAGIANQYVLYPSGGHGDWDAATYTDAFNKIQLFLNTYVP